MRGYAWGIHVVEGARGVLVAARRGVRHIEPFALDGTHKVLEFGVDPNWVPEVTLSAILYVPGVSPQVEERSVVVPVVVAMVLSQVRVATCAKCLQG